MDKDLIFAVQKMIPMKLKIFFFILAVVGLGIIGLIIWAIIELILHMRTL